MVDTKLIKRVDNREDRSIVLGQVQKGLTRQFPPNEDGGIKIPDDVWSEWITVAQYLCHVFPDPDIYDLFIWIREELNGCQPLSDAQIERADYEIERELARESRKFD